MSDATFHTAFAYAEPACEARWSPRRSLLFVVATSSALWTLIGVAIWAVL